MLTSERLREILHYDQETGVFTWLGKRLGAPKDKPAGTTIDAAGYRGIVIDRRRYLSHRLAWLYMTGEWPCNQIDHRDLDPSNNRWCNLREATNSQNHANIAIMCSNTSGLKGAFWHKHQRKWTAAIRCKRKLYNLGYFSTAEEAHSAYIEAANKLFGQYARIM
jgi:hypothetical protein